MTDQYRDGYVDLMVASVPAGRLGRREEFTAAVVFLASPVAGHITGVTLPVDGGALS